MRSGIFGITLVVCLMLVSFGYADLPFWPRGRHYEAFFTNAAGIVPGNDVQIYGYSVGKVTAVELADRSAKVGFIVDRDLRVGDQSTVAIKSDTVLGQKALEVAPAGTGIGDVDPVGPHHNSLLAEHRSAGPRAQRRRSGQAAAGRGTGRADRRHARRHPAAARRAQRRDRAVAQHQRPRRTGPTTAGPRQDRLRRPGPPIRTDEPTDRRGQPTVRRTVGEAPVAGHPDLAASTTWPGRSRASSPTTAQEFGPALTKLNLVLDNLETRRAQIDDSLRRLPSFASQLGEVVGSGPGFSANVYGVPPPQITGMALDAYFQPGKLPDSLADFLRGFIIDRAIIRPKSP